MTQKNADIALLNNVVVLSGNLNFYNVMSVYEKSLNYLNSTKELIFDFSKLEASDSSGLALIIEWIKFARKHHKAIQFKSISENLLSIAKVAGLEKFLT